MENDILYSVLPWLVLFLCCTVLVVYYLRIKHKERLRIIEKGDFALESNYLRNHKFSILSKGVILLSLSIGIGIAFAITISSMCLEIFVLFNLFWLKQIFDEMIINMVK
jgi:hypothetical protein